MHKEHIQLKSNLEITQVSDHQKFINKLKMKYMYITYLSLNASTIYPSSQNPSQGKLTKSQKPRRSHMQESFQHILLGKISSPPLLLHIYTLWFYHKTIISNIQGVNLNPKPLRCSKILQEDQETLVTQERERLAHSLVNATSHHTSE